MLEKILDLPVIVQGALGSFLFWLAYEVTKRIINTCSNLIGRYNKHWKHESLIFEQIQSLSMITTGDQRTHMLLTCVYGGLSLAIKGLIYLCFGLITSSLLGEISLIAYVFSVVYFYRALNSVKFEISGKGADYHNKRVEEIEAELKELNS